MLIYRKIYDNENRLCIHLHSLLFFSFKGIKVDVLEKILELGKLISGKRNALAHS